LTTNTRNHVCSNYNVLL